jgi:hypothetical protein
VEEGGGRERKTVKFGEETSAERRAGCGQGLAGWHRPTSGRTSAVEKIEGVCGHNGEDR